MDTDVIRLQTEVRRLTYMNGLLLDRLLALEEGLPLYQNNEGDKKMSLPHSQNNDWGRDNTLPQSKNYEGSTEASVPHSQNYTRGTNDFLPQSEKEEADKTLFLPPSQNLSTGGIPAADDEGLLLSIRQRLSAEGGMKGIRRSTIRHTAQALVHVARGGRLDYHFARTAYGYSVRGASKFIVGMQRHGLLERRGGRALFLTAKGLEMMAQAS